MERSLIFKDLSKPQDVYNLKQYLIEIYGLLNPLIRGTFVNSDLVSGVLTITHNLNLSAPYPVFVVIFNNNGVQIAPDSVIGAANSVAIDLTTQGSLSGTWGYVVL